MKKSTITIINRIAQIKKKKAEFEITKQYYSEKIAMLDKRANNLLDEIRNDPELEGEDDQRVVEFLESIDNAKIETHQDFKDLIYKKIELMIDLYEYE